MINTEWQLTGNMAERYEEFLVPVIFVPWAEELLRRAGQIEGQDLLDLACGTGIVARMAADRGARVVGSDINAGMLAQAARCSEGLGVRYEAADAQDLPFEDESFDLIICQQGLQFFPEKAGALAECFRVLRPGGRAIFCTARTVAENPLMHAQITAFGAHLGEETTGAIRAVCGFNDQRQIRDQFDGAGFDPVEIDHVVLDLRAEDGRTFVDGLMKATPVAERIAQMDGAERAALGDALLSAFGDHYDGAELTFPHSANVVTAVRPG